MWAATVGALILACTMVLAGPLGAQQAAPPAGVLTIELEKLLTGTLYGKAALARIDTQAQELLAQNRQIDSDLEAEEKALTARRATLPADEFRVLAQAFDEKVEGIRAAQEAKGRTLAQQRDMERQKVLQAVAPILGELMVERGASAIFEKKAVFLAFDRNDVTEEAIRRLDTALGAGDGARADEPAPSPVEPTPEPAPDATPP